MKVDKSAYFQPWFDQPQMGAKITRNLRKIGVLSYVSNGYLNPLSKHNSEKVEKLHLFNLGLTNLERGTK